MKYYKGDINNFNQTAKISELFENPYELSQQLIDDQLDQPPPPPEIQIQPESEPESEPEAAQQQQYDLRSIHEPSTSSLMLEKPPSTAPPLLLPEPVQDDDDIIIDDLKENSLPIVLYRYQKPITVDNLKHPHEKYKDLIYRPRFLTSQNLEPPTESLIPKYKEPPLTRHSTQRPKAARVETRPIELNENEDKNDDDDEDNDLIQDVKDENESKSPVLSFRPSRLGAQSIMSNRPQLVDELKLPIEKKSVKPPARKNARRATFIDNVRVPFEKKLVPTVPEEVEPEPVKFLVDNGKISKKFFFC